MCAILQTETRETRERDPHNCFTSFLSFLSCFVIIIIIVIILKLTTIVAEHSKNYTGRESKTKNQEWRWFNDCAVGKRGGKGGGKGGGRGGVEGLEKIYTSNSFAISAKCRMCRTCEAYVWVQKGNNKRILNKKNFKLSICLFWGLVELKGGGKREVGSVGREELILLL